MSTSEERTIVVMGATGLQGGAVTRHLLADGWHVRAVTRDPNSAKAKALQALGAEVIQGDMDEPDTLAPIFQGTYGVFSVQNPMISGVEREISQGKTVADTAAAGVQHLVYGSAGTSHKGTGVPSWESKLVVEEHIKSLGIPFTILRPMAFMELMTEKKFFPPVSTWNVMPQLMGNSTRIGWLSTHDLGFIAAKAFSEPQEFIGQELQLASDVRTLDECRTLYRTVMGKNPPRFPMPVWMYTRYGFVGRDTTVMWRWLRSNPINLDTGPTLALHPQAMSVEAWLVKQKSEG
jgi:uncharacterized protein YbjT (DUF2867 family)